MTGLNLGLCEIRQHILNYDLALGCVIDLIDRHNTWHEDCVSTEGNMDRVSRVMILWRSTGSPAHAAIAISFWYVAYCCSRIREILSNGINSSTVVSAVLAGGTLADTCRAFAWRCSIASFGPERKHDA
jgi:hypothetical protein